MDLNKKAKYSSVIICLNCLFPSVRTVDFDDEIKRVTEPHANLRVPARVYHVEGGAIFAKNSTFVFFDGFAWTPRLRSPSPIMAPDFNQSDLPDLTMSP